MADQRTLQQRVNDDLTRMQTLLSDLAAKDGIPAAVAEKAAKAKTAVEDAQPQLDVILADALNAQKLPNTTDFIRPIGSLQDAMAHLMAAVRDKNVSIAPDDSEFLTHGATMLFRALVDNDRNPDGEFRGFVRVA